LIAYTARVIWEAIFLLVILKIPIVYLCCVVYWAIKAEPRPEDGAALAGVPVDLDPRPGWNPRSPFERRTRRGPHGGPARRYARRVATPADRARAEQ
jgi:hypothetical protein